MSKDVLDQVLGGGGGEPPPALPDQVLENVLEDVLRFLTSRHDRNAASLVCKFWHRVEAQTRSEFFIGNCYAVSPHRAIERFGRVRSVVLKGKPRFTDSDLIPLYRGAHFSPWVAAMSPAYPWLEKLCLKRMSISDDDLAIITRSFPAFKELVIVSCDGFSTSGLALVAQLCRHLRVLDLFDDYIEDDDEVEWISEFPENGTCLETFLIDCYEHEVNFEALEALVARSPSLKRLNLNQNVSASQLCRLMARAPQLIHLGAGSHLPVFFPAPEDPGIDRQLISAFAASKSLVRLSGFHHIFTEYLHCIYPVCSNLASLNFSHTEITTEQFNPIILHCHNLQELWVPDTVRDEGLQAVAATCKDLRELRALPVFDEVEGCLSDVGLSAISLGCPKLQSILYFCLCMTNAAVVAMSKNCQDLEVFRLCIIGHYFPDYLTGEPMDEGFGAIVMNCKKLTRLTVSGLLTDKAFEYIGRYGKLVRTLSVAFAGNSDLGLKYVLQGCPKLQKLDIRDCPFGDTGLLSGLHRYSDMRFLWMSSCKLSLRACREVARSLPQLVVEVIRETDEDKDSEDVRNIYLYPSLAGPRNDAPCCVKFL